MKLPIVALQLVAMILNFHHSSSSNAVQAVIVAAHRAAVVKATATVKGTNNQHPK